MSGCMASVDYRPLAERMGELRCDVKEVARAADVPLPRVLELMGWDVHRRSGAAADILDGNQLVRVSAALGVPLGEVIVFARDASGDEGR